MKAGALLVSLLLSCTAQAAQPVRYCDHPVYPPISWSDGKQMRGLAPLMVHAVMAKLGFDVELVKLGNWKRCLLDAAEGRVDVVLAYSTAQREQSMLFSTVPVLREEVALFVNRQHPVKFEQLDDLAHAQRRRDPDHGRERGLPRPEQRLQPEADESGARQRRAPHRCRRPRNWPRASAA